MTCAAHASCSALLCFLQGADLRKQRGLLWQWPCPPLVIAVPASDRPPVALTFALGAEIYRILCWQKGVFQYCWAGWLWEIIIFNETQLFQSAGRGEACACCQLHIQYNLGHSEVEEQRKVERTGTLLDIMLKSVSWNIVVEGAFAHKEMTFKTLESWTTEMPSEPSSWMGPMRKEQSPQKICKGRANPITASSCLTVVPVYWDCFHPLMEYTTAFWILPPRGYKPDVFSQKCASYPNCRALNVACLQSPLQMSSTHAHVLSKGRGRWTVSLHLWDGVVSSWKPSISSHFL